jgi:hypothetical protein
MKMTPLPSTALQRLRAVNLRPTRQRLALARLLLEKGERHVTAEQLHGEAVAAGIGVSLATIYNTLHQFTDCGFLREVVVEADRISTPTPPIITTFSARPPASCRTSRAGNWLSAGFRHRRQGLKSIASK